MRVLKSDTKATGRQVRRWFAPVALLFGLALVTPGCLWEPEGPACPGLAPGDQIRVDVVALDPSSGAGRTCEEAGFDLGWSSGFVATVEAQRGESCFVWGRAELNGEFSFEFPPYLNEGEPDFHATDVWSSEAIATGESCSGNLELHLDGLNSGPFPAEPSKTTLRIGWYRRSGDGAGCPSDCGGTYTVSVTRIEGAGGAGP